MATTYLINSTRVGTLFLHAGTLIDDTQVDVTALANAGGRTWPSTDATVAAAAARCVALRGQGQSGSVLDDIMEAAVAASVNTTGATTGAKNIALTDAASIVSATDVEGAIAELAGGGARRVARVVITSIAAYAGTGTGVLTASATGAIGAQDGATLTAGQLVFLPKVTGGAGGTTVAADVGPWIVTDPGGATKFVLTRPAWWAHGAAIQQAFDIPIAEGTVWIGSTWRTTCAAGLLVDTGDPLFYPDVQKGTGAVGTVVNGIFALASAQPTAVDATAAAAVKAVLAAGNGTGTLTFTGTGTDAINWTVQNR